MKFLRANARLRNRYLAAIAGGLLLTTAFPKPEIAGLAWIAPGLMAASALGMNGGDRWRIGYSAGLAHYLSMLYWLLFIPYRWNGLPLGPCLGWVALSGFLALFTATWVWIVTRPAEALESIGSGTQPPRGLAESTLHPAVAEPELVAGLGGALPRTWLGRTLWTLFGAVAWVAIEMAIARIFGGFPWDLLGVSQYRLAPLIQIASVTGVYGVSFIVAWVSLALVSAAVMVIRRPTVRAAWVSELFLPLMMVAVVFNQGLRVLKEEPSPQRTIRVTLIQPSIPQTTIWNPSLDTNRFRALVDYTDQVLTNKTDLLIWPESAVPNMVRYDQETYDAVTGLAKRHGIWMIIGSDDAEPKQDNSAEGAADYFNSSFLITPEGQVVARYLKRGLVIFGEYVPLAHWLPFLRWFTPVQGGFTAGKEPGIFHLRALKVNASMLICFEDIFPQLARVGVDQDTDLLVNITNDGWFGRSAAQWQHAYTALFRTVENRVPLIRCCNNGLSCWIDARGRIREVLRDTAGTVYGKGSMTLEIPIPETDQQRRLTYYTRHGDVFGWVCVGIAASVLSLRVYEMIWHRRNPRRMP